MPILQFATDRRNKILVGATAGVALVVGIAAGISNKTPVHQVTNSSGIKTWEVLGDGSQSGSGDTLFGSGSKKVLITNKGNVKAQGTMTGNRLYAGTMSGAGLADCDDGTTNKLLWDATTQRYSCGTDQTGGGGGFGTGNVLTIANKRYVSAQGDTMTGGLLIQSGNPDTNTIDAGLLLEVVGTASGRQVHAQDGLSSSGSLVWEGTASGAKIRGLGLIDCDSAVTSKLLWDTTLGTFSCGTDTDTDTNTTYTAGQGLTLTSTAFRTNATLTGTLVNFTTLSGTTVYARSALRSSGSLAWDSAGSGDSLWVSTFNGSGLTDCDAAADTLNWDTTTRKFSCGSDADTNQNLFETIAVSGQSNVVADSTTDTLTFAAGSNITLTTAAGTDTVTIASADTNTVTSVGQGLLLSSGLLTLNTTNSGSLSRYTTQSGSLVYAKNTLASSGSLVVEGTVTFDNALTVANGGTGFSSCTDGGFITGNAASALTCNAILTDNQIYIGDGATEPTATAIPECTSTQKIQYTDSGNGLTCVADVDTNTVTAVGQGLLLNSGLLTRIAALTGSSLKVNGSMSGSNLVVSGRPACVFTATSSTGALICNNTVDDTEFTNEDFGDFTCTGSEDGCTVDANAVALTTDTTGNYAAGDAEAGAALTGDSATSFFSTGILELGIGGTGFSSCTDGGFITGNATATFTCNAVLGDDVIYVGDGTTEPTEVTLPSCSAAGDTLNYNSGTNAFACGTDADTTYAAGQGLTLVTTVFSLSSSFSGSSLEIMGTSSGRTLHAQDLLRSSGSLIIQTTGLFKGNLTTRGTASGAALTFMGGNSFILGNFSMGTSTAASVALEVIGTASGQILHAQDILRSSGSLIVEKRVYYGSGSLRIADDGTPAQAAVGTLTPTNTHHEVFCDDVDGCTLNISETGAGDGQLLIITLGATGFTTTIQDSAGVVESQASALSDFDSWALIYARDRWIQISQSDN